MYLRCKYILFAYMYECLYLHVLCTMHTGQCDSSSCKQVVVTLEGGSSVQSALSYVMFGDGGSGSGSGRRSRLGLGLDLSGFKLSVTLSNMRLSLALLMQVTTALCMYVCNCMYVYFQGD